MLRTNSLTNLKKATQRNINELSLMKVKDLLKANEKVKIIMEGFFANPKNANEYFECACKSISFGMHNAVQEGCNVIQFSISE